VRCPSVQTQRRFMRPFLTSLRMLTGWWFGIRIRHYRCRTNPKLRAGTMLSQARCDLCACSSDRTAKRLSTPSMISLLKTGHCGSYLEPITLGVLSDDSLQEIAASVTPRERLVAERRHFGNAAACCACFVEVSDTYSPASSPHRVCRLDEYRPRAETRQGMRDSAR